MPEAQSAAQAERGRKVCFVVAPIGEPDTETRKKSDQVLRHIVKPCLEPDYEVVRADQISRPGVITVQIVQRLFDADLVVADLTERNANVYYELAIRHATGKPSLHIASHDQQIPFDVQDMRFVRYDLTNPDSLDEARKALHEHVEAIERGESIITPVQIAEILQSLKVGESQEAQIRTLFESLNTGMSNLQEGIAEVVNDLRRRKQIEAWALSSGQQPPIFTLADMALTSPLASAGSSFAHTPRTFMKAAERVAKAEAVAKAKEGKESKDKK